MIVEKMAPYTAKSIEGEALRRNAEARKDIRPVRWIVPKVSAWQLIDVDDFPLVQIQATESSVFDEGLKLGEVLLKL